MSIDSASWMFCPFVHFFLDRQKVSLKNTPFLPSLRSITGWHYSVKVSTIGLVIIEKGCLFWVGFLKKFITDN